MTALLDTNVIVRYLTGDNAELSALARRIIDDTEDLLVPSIVLAEVAFVLGSFYRVPRDRLVDQLIELIRKSNLDILAIDKPLAIQALMLCRPSGRVSFVDALTWAHARSERIGVIYTFDKEFPAEGIELRAGT
jgi:predicted nucleic acid-binding protein